MIIRFLSHIIMCGYQPARLEHSQQADRPRPRNDGCCRWRNMGQIHQVGISLPLKLVSLSGCIGYEMLFVCRTAWKWKSGRPQALFHCQHGELAGRIPEWVTCFNHRIQPGNGQSHFIVGNQWTPSRNLMKSDDLQKKILWDGEMISSYKSQELQSARAGIPCAWWQEIRPARAEDTPGCTSAGRACAASQVAAAGFLGVADATIPKIHWPSWWVRWTKNMESAIWKNGKQSAFWVHKYLARPLVKGSL